jgi:hypothetical protein
MEIVIKGESNVGVAGLDVDKKWSKRSSASWQANVRITSEWDGLHVNLLNAAKPVFHKTETEGEVAVSMDTHKLLTTHMPAVVNMDAVLSQLKMTLEGTYKYAVAGVCKYTMYSPVFNAQGDLILQLRPYDPSAKPPPPPPVTPKVIEMPNSPKTPGSRSQSKGPGPQPRPLGGSKKRSCKCRHHPGTEPPNLTLLSGIVRKIDGAVDFIQDAVHRDGEDERKVSRRSSTIKSLQSPILESPKPIGYTNGHGNGFGNGVANGKASFESKTSLEKMQQPPASAPKVATPAVSSPKISTA